MAHFAEVKNGVVTNVIVAERAYIDTLKNKTSWIQTSYNTRGGKHLDPKTLKADGGVALRGNYAGIGYTYDSTNDVFIPPKIYPSWVLNKTTWLWESPTPMPSDETKYYVWDEPTVAWVEKAL